MSTRHVLILGQDVDAKSAFSIFHCTKALAASTAAVAFTDDNADFYRHVYPFANYFRDFMLLIAISAAFTN